MPRAGPGMRVLIFDLDGTLAETRLDIAAAANHALRVVGLAEIAVDRITTFVGEGAARLIERCLGARRDLFAPAMAAWTAHYEAHLLDTTILYEGVAATLARLSVPLAVLSNKPKAMTHAILEGLGIARHFAASLGGDSLPSKKPDPSGVREILRRTGAARAVLIGDTPVDVETARAAQIPCWGAAYGFAGRAALEMAGADSVFDRFEEIEKLETA
ncbi:MAG: phosphoglycolate [Planctomycetota bacterium]|nr:MAG: phosphoglycolate [Planctomycetota bacterium]